jgi:hypothetical protein
MTFLCKPTCSFKGLQNCYRSNGEGKIFSTKTRFRGLRNMPMIICSSTWSFKACWQISHSQKLHNISNRSCPVPHKRINIRSYPGATGIDFSSQAERKGKKWLMRGAAAQPGSTIAPCQRREPVALAWLAHRDGRGDWRRSRAATAAARQRQPSPHRDVERERAMASPSYS